jgi:colanic acid/amylovoran biosynthesis glycosyltransferase
MSRFPLLTETFILREMLELERRGAKLKVLPLLREQPSVRHDEIQQLSADVYYTPFISRAIVSANVHFFRRNPRRYLTLLWSVLRGNWGSANLFMGALGIFPKSVYFARLVERLGVGHVHAHYATHPALSALIVSELTGVGFSFTAHAHDIFLHQRMLAEKVQKARFVAAISEFNKRYLLRLAPDTPPERVQVVHCGIELENYGTTAAPPGDPTRSDEGAITAVCVASLQPYKGIKYLVRACAQVAERVPGFRCLIVGEGPDRPELEALIAALGLEGTVQLLGGKPQREVANLLQNADLFVLPSIIAPSGQMEGIPVALMEAMASRLPVIATALSGIPELVEHGTTGLLVTPADEAALAEAIATLCCDPALRRLLGEKAREKVAADFELRQSVAGLLDLFEEAASEKAVAREFRSDRAERRVPEDAFCTAGGSGRKSLER